MHINFSKCQRIATKLLSKQHLSTAKINVMKLQYDKKIVFYSIQEYVIITHEPITNYYSNGKLIDGCTIKRNNLYIVLYNDNLCDNRKNWTIAHEIGHIYLGHTKDTDLEEIEAHFFAAQLLMPEYVLYKICEHYGKFKERDLLNIFFVSEDAVLKRIKTYNSKYYHSFYEGDADIWYMLKDDIDKYYKNNLTQKRNPLPYEPQNHNFIIGEEEWLYGFL